MPRTFAYCRVSTAGQTTENQVLEIQSAGFAVDKRRVVSETISGGVQAAQRPGFAKLLERLEEGDILVVTKLDRLGRNVIDVRQTARTASRRAASASPDPTSAAGRMTMGVLSAVAELRAPAAKIAF